MDTQNFGSGAGDQQSSGGAGSTAQSSAQASAQDWVGKVTNFVREQPVKAVAITAVVGLAAPMLLGRSIVRKLIWGAVTRKVGAALLSKRVI